MKAGIDEADWPAVNALLDEALSLPPTERDAWLESLPAERRRHRDTVARLLAASTGIETDQLLQWPRFTLAGAAAERDAPTAAEGDVVGPYILFRVLGQGGMGAVWLAERADAQPRRKVALKLPHVGWQPGLAQRLARERDILASLEHPHIARLYDAGVDAAGRPWLALEYVDGTPIDRYVEARRLGVRERLGLLLQVASAVAHAHTRLVVHRDLKPSNILVTEAGEVRLLDFGIAKLLQDDGPAEATELTRVSGRALTPEYASPEQIRGDAVGTASDVYSLGVVAHELLAGQRPKRFEAGKALLWADDADGDDAPPASKACADPATRKALAGDLDAILAKALRKAPAERYATVAELAADIERHLDDRPVQARPASFGYRSRKFVKRHALRLATAAILLATVLVGAGGALWQARVARAEAARALEIKTFALSLFKAADSDTGAGAGMSAADLLVEAQRRVDTELRDRPELSVELMNAIGSSLLEQGKTEEGIALLRRSLAIGRTKLGGDDARTVSAGQLLGSALIDVEPDAAMPLLLDTAARARRLRLSHELAASLAPIASRQMAQGDADAAIATAREAIGLFPRPRTFEDRADALSCWLTYVYVLSTAKRPGVAEAAARAIELSRETYGDRITHDVLSARSYHADGIAEEPGRLAEALEEKARVVEDAVRFFGPLHREVGFMTNGLARLQLEAGDAAAAASNFAKVRGVALAPGGEGKRTAAWMLARIGDARFVAGDWQGALDGYSAARSELASAPGAAPWMRWRIDIGRASTLVHLGRLSDAESAFAGLRDATLDAPTRASLESAMSALRVRQDRAQEAVDLARRGLRDLERDPSARVRAEAHARVGEALLASGRFEEASSSLARALAEHRSRELRASGQQTRVAESLAAARRGGTAQAPS